MKRVGTIRFGVIADTHGLYDTAIESHFSDVTEILHAGDIGDPRIIERLRRMAPVVAVSGNVDDYEESGFPRRVIIRRSGVRLAICHVLYEKGKMTKEAQEWLERERPTICVFGHSHRPEISRYGTTILFNPGSAGPRRFSLPRGIGLLSLRNGRVKTHLISLPIKAQSSTR